MSWLDKLKEYAPDIAMAVLSGGATLPQLALKAVADATGQEVTNETQMAEAIDSASPEIMAKVKQANNAFKIRMAELGNELIVAQLGDVQNARGMYGKHNEQADKIAHSIITFNIMYVVAVALAQILAITMTDLPSAAVVVIGNVCGWIIKGLLDERLQVCGFYFGSSLGSKNKGK